MATGSQAMTSFYAKRIIGDSVSNGIADGLLQVNVSNTKLVTRSHNNNSAYYIAYVDDTNAGIDIIEFQNINLELTNTAGDTLTFSTSTIESSGQLSVNTTSTSAVVFGGNIHTDGVLTIGNLQGFNLILDNHSIFAREWDSTNEEYIDSALSLGGNTSIDGYLNVVGDFHSGGDIYLAEAKSIFMNYTVPGEEGEEGTPTDFPILVNNDDGTVSLNSLTGALHLGYLNTEEIHIYTSDSSTNTDWFVINEDGPYATTNLGVGGQDTDYVFYVNGTSYLNGNLTIKGDGIYYAGTQNTYRMIRFIDNTGDIYGNGISIGGGGLTVIGSGESADTLISNLNLTTAGGTETTYIASDGNIEFYPGQNSYSAAARIWMTAGVLNIGVNGDTTRENSLNIYSGAGRLQLYSAASTTGNRGLWVAAHGTGSAKNIVLIDTNNIAKFVGSFGDDVSYTIRYINSTDTTTWTADTLGATTSFAIIRASVTGAHTTGHIFFLNVNDVGTPFQLAIHDSSELYFYKRYKSSGSWTAWTKMNAGNADTATRINGNLAAATSDVNRNIWVSSTASADGIPNYISGFNMNPSTKVFTVPSDTRISPSGGALYLGNSGNNSWVYVQDMASQDSSKWKLHQNGNAEFTGTVTAPTFSGNATSASALTAYASIGSSTTDHGVALKNWFTSNKSTAGPNKVISFYSSTSSNGSQYIGYFLSGYANNPYGGFFVCHYNNPYYVGISNGTYTQQHILTSTNYTSYTVTKTGSGASGSWDISVTGSAGSVAWGNITGKPSTFSPATHNHDSSYVNISGDTMSGTLAIVNNSQNNGTYNSLLYIEHKSNNDWGMIINKSTSYDYGLQVTCKSDGSYGISVTGRITGTKVYGAVWNDYAECRKVNIDIPAGYVVYETNNKIMEKAYTRLQPGCKVVSDTYGMCIGETEEAKVPIAVTGRVLVYPYRNVKEYELGVAVCSAPGGTIDIMTREEIMMYPERIIGTVSEIPDYEIWRAGERDGNHDIQVNGRIWIYVR